MKVVPPGIRAWIRRHLGKPRRARQTSCGALYGHAMHGQSANQRGKSTKKCRKPPFSCCFCFPIILNMRYPAALRVSRDVSCNPAPRSQRTERMRQEVPLFRRFLATSRKLDRRPGGLTHECCRGRSSGRPAAGRRAPEVRMADLNGALRTRY